VIFRCEGLKGELFINDLMTAKMPGETIHVNIVRGGVGQVLPVQLGQNIKRTYSFHAIPNPSATQAAILEDWLRTAQ
jgi:Tfp pilus assembly protein FimV